MSNKYFREYRLITKELIHQIDDLVNEHEIERLTDLRDFFYDGFKQGIDDDRVGTHELVEYIDIVLESIEKGEPNPYIPKLRQDILDDLKDN